MRLADYHLKAKEDWPDKGQTSVWVSGVPSVIRMIVSQARDRFPTGMTPGPICWDLGENTGDLHYCVLTFSNKQDALMFKLSVE